VPGFGSGDGGSGKSSDAEGLTSYERKLLVLRAPPGSLRFELGVGGGYSWHPGTRYRQSLAVGALLAPTVRQPARNHRTFRRLNHTSPRLIIPAFP